MTPDPRRWAARLTAVVWACTLICASGGRTAEKIELAAVSSRPGQPQGFDPGQFPQDRPPDKEEKTTPLPPGCGDQVLVPATSANGLVDIEIINPCRKDQVV